MEKEDFHIRFRDVASVSLLFAALDNSFPHFLNNGTSEPEDISGKNRREKVFNTLRAFSTSFPQYRAETKH